MTPPQLFLIKEQIIIPFGFPFALFGNWKKVILTEATVLIFWLYLIRQTVCPKKIHFRGESWQVCLKRADIRTIFSLPIINKKKYSTFLLLSQFISQESSDQIIFLNFRLQFYKNTNMNPPPQTLFGLNDTCQICFDFVCRIQIKKSHNEPHDLQKKKFLGKWLEIPISHLFTVIIQKI